MICLEAVTYWTSINSYFFYRNCPCQFDYSLLKMQHCEFFNLNGFSFYVCDTQFHFMCTLYSTDITSQDKNLYIFPVLLMCLPYKLNTTNLSTNQRGCRLQTSPECYSMSDTCNLNIKLKNRQKESLLWYTYSMQKCIIQYTKHTNIVKLMASTQTIKTHRHVIIQYSTLLSLH